MGPESEVPLRRAREPDAPRPFFARLPGALAYPFRGIGIFVIVAGAVFFWLLNVLAKVPFVGLLVAGFVTCYLSAYMLKIIGRTAAGDESPPDWPDVTDFYSDLLRPLLLLLGVVIVCLLPTMAYLVYCAWTGPPLEASASGGRSWVHSVNPAVAWTLIGVGLVYLPMGMVAVALFETVTALNPVVVLTAIVKVAPAYLTALVVLVASIVVSGLIQKYLAASIPVIGSLLAGGVMLYFLLVEMYVLGLIYHSYEERLGWFT